MIIRVFRAIVHEGQEAAFRRLFVETLLPEIRRQPGLVSAEIGLPHEGTPREFAMISCWQDLDALRAFAGDRWRNAVIDPREAHLLEETFVHHYASVS